MQPRSWMMIITAELQLWSPRRPRSRQCQPCRRLHAQRLSLPRVPVSIARLPVSIMLLQSTGVEECATPLRIDMTTIWRRITPPKSVVRARPTGMNLRMIGNLDLETGDTHSPPSLGLCHPKHGNNCPRATPHPNRRCCPLRRGGALRHRIDGETHRWTGVSRVGLTRRADRVPPLRLAQLAVLDPRALLVQLVRSVL
jgi:hypothetical protein